jgi:hypothetical protein
MSMDLSTTTLIIDCGNDTYIAAYAPGSVQDVVAALKSNDWVRCDSELGEIYANPLNVAYAQAGRREIRRTTAAAAGNSDQQRLVGGQSL